MPAGLEVDWFPDAVASGNRGPALALCGVYAPTRPGKPVVSAPSLLHSERRQGRVAAARPVVRELFPIHPGWANVRHGGPAAHSGW